MAALRFTYTHNKHTQTHTLTDSQTRTHPNTDTDATRNKNTTHMTRRQARTGECKRRELATGGDSVSGRAHGPHPTNDRAAHMRNQDGPKMGAVLRTRVGASFKKHDGKHSLRPEQPRAEEVPRAGARGRGRGQGHVARAGAEAGAGARAEASQGQGGLNSGRGRSLMPKGTLQCRRGGGGFNKQLVPRSAIDIVALPCLGRARWLKQWV